MSNTESSTVTAHQFSSINISGNARVIVGSTHGSDHGLQSERPPPVPWPTQFGIRLTPSSSCAVGGIAKITVLPLARYMVKDFTELIDTMQSVRDHARFTSTRISVPSDLTARWSDDIMVRWVIFRSCLERILLACSEPHVAPAMLQDQEHPMWNSSRFSERAYQKFEQRLGSIEAMLKLIDQDIATLRGILEAFKTFLRLQVPPPDVKYQDMDRWLLQLRHHIHDFRDLVQQDVSAQPSTPTAAAPSHIKDKVVEFRTVQEAASDLYRSFLLACEQHKQHRVWLRIEANKCQAQDIKFNLVFDRYATMNGKESSEQRAKMFLVIMSALKPTLYSPSTFPMVSEYICAVQHRDTQPQQKGRKRRKLHSTSTPTEQQAPAPPIPNFCEKGDMCTHISRGSTNLCKEELLLGILSATESSRHTIYTSKEEATTHSSQIGDKLQYITQILASSDEEVALMTHVKIRLAKQLSITVLQYNATPWLQHSWDSDHVLVENGDSQRSNEEDFSSVADLDSPRNMSYLDVTIQKLSRVDGNIISNAPRTMIRNMTLFRLGVMLIELAYGRSFRSMQKPEDIFIHTNARVSEENTDYCIADRLQKGVARKLGPVYAKLVRQCIDCDFGHGQDLSKPELQEGFYEHVIDKLDVLEAKFKDLGI